MFLISIAAEYLEPTLFLGPYTLFVIPVGLWIVDRYFSGVARAPRASRAGLSERLWRLGTILPWLLFIGLAVWAMRF